MAERLSTNDLLFRVADVHFRIIFKDIEDGRPFLPSFAPFHITDMPNEPLLFTLVVGNGESSDVSEGEEVGQFDCGG